MPDERDKRLLLLDIIQRINDRLHEAGVSDATFALVADSLREISGADFTAVVLLDPDGVQMRMVGASGDREVSPADFGSYVPDLSMRSVMADGSKSNALVWESLDKAPPSARQIMEKYGVSSAMVFSVVFRNKVMGYLVIASRKSGAPFGADTESAAMSLADFMGLAVDSARSESLVRRSEEENHRILSIAPIGIMSLDSKGIIQSVNVQMLRVLDKKSEGELVGTSIFEISAVHRSGLDALVIQGMEGHPAEKVDLHYVPRQDRAFYLHVKVAPLLSERGEVEEVVLVAMDITSKVRLESQLERSYEKLTQTYQELERVTKMKTQFIDVVSHELRTPLTVMRGYVDLVEGEYGPKLDQRFAQRLRIIKANTDKLYGLVESMLDISRLEKGILEIHPEPVRVDAILEDVVGDRGKDAEEKKQTLTLSVDGAIPVVMADRRRMRDVFNNLIDNAVKYTEEGGRIQVGCRDEGRIVHAWVKDNGIGIPLENLGRIFDRFYIVAKDDLAHQVDRIGLSLPIAKGIVEAHGGRLWVESQVGKGSVFHIDLPKEQAK